MIEINLEKEVGYQKENGYFPEDDNPIFDILEKKLGRRQNENSWVASQKTMQKWLCNIPAIAEQESNNPPVSQDDYLSSHRDRCAYIKNKWRYELFQDWAADKTTLSLLNLPLQKDDTIPDDVIILKTETHPGG